MSMETGPFDDPLFRAIAARHGCHDRGSSWHLVNLDPMHTPGTDDWGMAGARGIESERIVDLPSGMPRFRFARSDGVASLMVEGDRYVYSARGASRQITVLGETLPETLLLSAQGRRLSEYVDLPGAADETIVQAVAGGGSGRIASIVLTLAQGEVRGGRNGDRRSARRGGKGRERP